MVRKEPSEGDRILVFKEEWLQKVLSKQKTLEIRNKALQAGSWWLASKGQIHAQAVFGTPMQIDAAKFKELKSQHLVDSDALPYKKKNWAIPLLNVKHLKPAIPYDHPKGAVSIVIYRGPATTKGEQ